MGEARRGVEEGGGSGGGDSGSRLEPLRKRVLNLPTFVSASV